VLWRRHGHGDDCRAAELTYACFRKGTIWQSPIAPCPYNTQIPHRKRYIRHYIKRSSGHTIGVILRLRAGV
jgi:hypothetical protein